MVVLNTYRQYSQVFYTFQVSYARQIIMLLSFTLSSLLQVWRARLDRKTFEIP